jgi:hypothetical protein
MIFLMASSAGFFESYVERKETVEQGRLAIKADRLPRMTVGVCRSRFHQTNQTSGLRMRASIAVDPLSQDASSTTLIGIVQSRVSCFWVCHASAATGKHERTRATSYWNHAPCIPRAK